MFVISYIYSVIILHGFLDFTIEKRFKLQWVSAFTTV